MDGEKGMKTKVFLAAFCVSSCTYANVQTTPIMLADGHEAYRYTGRANFTHQLQEADQVMQQTCAEKGGSPVIVSQNEHAIGGGAILAQNTATIGINRQQDILFRCVKTR